LEQCCALVEEQLAQVDFAGKQPANLYDPVVYALGGGGKRIRPALTLMACDLFGGDMQAALTSAVAVEIFHNFTLVHDDVMDNADVRRGRPAVHKRWSESVAILSGDAMQVLAYQYLCRTAQTEILPDVLRIFSETTLKVCEGQQYDMDFERRQDVSIEEYLYMIRLKTAELLAGSLKIGALCGGAPAPDIDRLYAFGIALGLSFQIRDDLLDVYADPAVFGKRLGGDILSGKKTFLLLTALKRADEATRKTLLHIAADKTMADEDKTATVKAIYDALKVDKAAEQMVETYCKEAIEHLDMLPLQDETRKDELKKLATVLLKRNK
jgi:geranylgeranyl diphosphate synthase type II